MASEFPHHQQHPPLPAQPISETNPYIPPVRPRRQVKALQKSALPLYKQRSWSPDLYRDEAWLKRKGNSRNRRSKSVTDDDLDELKACIELGFGFNSSEADPKLSDTLPALQLYYSVVNKQENHAALGSSPPDSDNTMFNPSDNPQMVKTRLRQWAQVVACSVRQSSS